MADNAEVDAGDPEVLEALLSTEDTPRVKEGEVDPTPDEGEEPSEREEDAQEETEEDQAAKAEDEEDDTEELEIDDVDELLVAVSVNGQEVEVPLKVLKQNFSGNQFIEQNIQKAVEVRKAVEYNAAALYHANQQVAQKLQSLDAVLDTMASPNIDWANLKARNPQEYILKREELRDIADKQRLVQQEIERVEAEQTAIQVQARQRLVLDQAQRLAERVPVLNDPEMAPRVMGALVRTAEHYGFSREEVGGVLDHRQMLVLYDAAQWRHYVEQQNQVRRKTNGDASASDDRSPQRKVLIRPGSSQGTAVAQSKRLTAEIYNRAMKTGSVEDVAKTLIMSSPTRR